MIELRLLASYFLFAVSSIASADIPTLTGALHLAAPPTGGRSASNGKLFVVQLQGSQEHPSGLQVVDTSDVKSPRLMGFFSLSLNGNMALAPDGQIVLISIASEKERYNNETEHDVIAIDLSRPDDPHEIWRRKVMARDIVLSASANAFAYSHHSTKSPNEWETTIVSATNPQSQTSIEEGA